MLISAPHIHRQRQRVRDRSGVRVAAARRSPAGGKGKRRPPNADAGLHAEELMASAGAPVRGRAVHGWQRPAWADDKAREAAAPSRVSSAAPSTGSAMRVRVPREHDQRCTRERRAQRSAGRDQRPARARNPGNATAHARTIGEDQHARSARPAEAHDGPHLVEPVARIVKG